MNSWGLPSVYFKYKSLMINPPLLGAAPPVFGDNTSIDFVLSVEK